MAARADARKRRENDAEAMSQLWAGHPLLGELAKRDDEISRLKWVIRSAYDELESGCDFDAIDILTEAL